MSNPKKGIRWKIFKLFGPPELKNLVDYIDSLMDHGTDVAIYPMGEFSFSVKTSNDDDIDPLVFPTPQERASFQLGMDYGVSIMGGTTTGLSKDEFEELEKMTKKATHGGGGHRDN